MIKYLLLAHNALFVPYFNHFKSIIADIIELFITNMY